MIELSTLHHVTWPQCQGQAYQHHLSTWLLISACLRFKRSYLSGQCKLDSNVQLLCVVLILEVFFFNFIHLVVMFVYTEIFIRFGNALVAVYTELCHIQSRGIMGICHLWLYYMILANFFCRLENSGIRDETQRCNGKRRKFLWWLWHFILFVDSATCSMSSKYHARWKGYRFSPTPWFVAYE